MGNRDRNNEPPTPANTGSSGPRRSPAAPAAVEPLDPEELAADDPVAPFAAPAGALADGTDVESAAGADAGVEWAGSGRPEQIDPSSGGKIEI